MRGGTDASINRHAFKQLSESKSAPTSALLHSASSAVGRMRWEAVALEIKTFEEFDKAGKSLDGSVVCADKDGPLMVGNKVGS